MTQAIGYSRCNVGDLDKLRRQRDAIAAWSARTGIPIAAWYTDESLSGQARLTDSPGLRACILATKALEHGVLVATALDRLSRRNDKLIAVLADLYSSGAEVMTTDQADDRWTRAWLALQRQLAAAGLVVAG